ARDPGAGRAEETGAADLRGHGAAATADPGRAEPARDRTVARPSRAHEGLAAASACDLERHVGRGAEPVDAELAPRAHLAAPESPVADDTGAEQRGGLGVAEHGWNRVGERLGGHRVVGEATVGVIPSELGALAQVLAPAAARAA